MASTPLKIAARAEETVGEETAGEETAGEEVRI